MLSVAFVAIPQFAIQLELQRRGESRSERPIVLVTPPEEGGRVFARTPDAGKRGIGVGLPLRLALTRCNEAEFWTADVPYYDERNETLLDMLETVSPIVEPGGVGNSFVSLKGLERLYGDEATIAEMIRERSLATFKMEPRIGIAASKFEAKLAACSRPERVNILRDEQSLEFLERISIDVLPLAEERKRRLRLLGIHSLGEMKRLSRHEMQLQCGKEGGLAWDVANGRDHAPLQPRVKRRVVKEKIRFPNATANEELVLAALQHLTRRLFHHPVVRDRYVRRIIVRGGLVSGTIWEKVVVFREPLCEVDDVVWLLRSKREQWKLPAAL